MQVWAVLKPGFLALLADPLDTQPLDIIVFDVLPASDGNGEGRVSLAKEVKGPNPLRHAFQVSNIYAFCLGLSLVIYILYLTFEESSQLCNSDCPKKVNLLMNNSF